MREFLEGLRPIASALMLGVAISSFCIGVYMGTYRGDCQEGTYLLCLSIINLMVYVLLGVERVECHEGGDNA